jgi:hypothetical protein
MYTIGDLTDCALIVAPEESATAEESGGLSRLTRFLSDLRAGQSDFPANDLAEMATHVLNDFSCRTFGRMHEGSLRYRGEGRV